MTQEDKKLLYKDLAARQPYRPFIRFAGKVTIPFLDVIGSTESNELMSINGLGLDDVKVYLRPMSSMTEEERKYISDKCGFSTMGPIGGVFVPVMPIFAVEWLIDFYNSNHFDYRGLIEKGLAIEAPEGMYA